MEYKRMIPGIFLERPNRFIALVEIDGKVEKCHVKNTSRCRELLYKGVKVIVEKADNPARKTQFSLICVYKGTTLINMDSQAPNQVVEEWIRQGNLLPDLTYLKREVKYGNSRFDIFAQAGGRDVFVEVKGVTLEENGVARFPDAPTERGKKHVLELCDCIENGYDAYVVFVIQMKGIRYFEPNDCMQKEFGDALRMAQKKGVHIVAVWCDVTETSLDIAGEVEVRS